MINMKKISEEKKKVEKYMLDLAKKLEKSGFEYFAARIYERIDKLKAKKIYSKIAKKLEKEKFFMQAAMAYESAGSMNKSKKLWKIVEKEMTDKNIEVLRKEAHDKSK